MDDSIAVGIDGSEAAHAALVWAAHRASERGIRLAMLHAVESSRPAEGDHELSAPVEADAVAWVRSAEPKLEYETRVLTGDPVKTLAAASRDYGMLVIGTHKTGFLRGRAFGSRGIRLASDVDCPLVVIPAGIGRNRKNIVVGVDGYSPSGAAVLFGCLEAALTGGDVTVVHHQTYLGDCALDEALLDARRAFPDVHIRTRAVLRSPSESLLDASRTASLLVLEAEDGGSAGLGAIAHDVLLNIAGPTVVLPAGWTVPADADRSQVS